MEYMFTLHSAKHLML